MRVLRIVPNVAADDDAAARHFYGTVLGLDLLMDHGWIATFGGPGQQRAQLSIGSEGGSGTPMPSLSIEVDDCDAALARVLEAGVPVVYGPVDEPWGVRRFFVRDPGGALLNILAHRAGP